MIWAAPPVVADPRPGAFRGIRDGDFALVEDRGWDSQSPTPPAAVVQGYPVSRTGTGTGTRDSSALAVLHQGGKQHPRFLVFLTPSAGR